MAGANSAFEETELADRAVVAVTGAEARGFLQNLVTADIAAPAVYAGLLTPQGKILFDLFILSRPDSLWIDVARPRLQEFVDRLKLYRLRARLDIAEVQGIHVSASPVAGDHADPRLPEMGYRSYGSAPKPARPLGYHAHRLSLGLADSFADLDPGAYFPHEANFDRLKAVSFTKGCYVGQEVVSRMEHRGTARSRMRPVVIAGGAPPKGTDITAGTTMIGHVLSGESERALALIRLDRLAESVEPPMAAGRPVTVLELEWMRSPA